ncbi:MAG: c-type cytochrome domain-containing protein [Pirellulales bacterium]
MFRLALTSALLLAVTSVLAEDVVSYRQHVWPILKRHCWGCHSAGDSQGGLKLDAFADVTRGGDSGPLFVPGKPAESLLMEMVLGEPPAMPKNQPRLSVEKVELLRRWIELGAIDDSPPGAAELAVQIPVVYKYAPAVTGVSLSPDGKWAAAACGSEAVILDVEGETPPRRLPTESELLPLVEFSPDGTLLAVGGGAPGRYGEVRFFKVADGSLVSTWRIGADTLFRGGFNPNGQEIAIGGPDGAVHIVPVDGNAEPRRFELHSDWVMDVAYTPDGQMLVSGGRDKATKVSSAATGALLRAVDASPDFVNAVAASELMAVSAGRARTLTGFEFKIALEGVQVSGSGNGAQPVNRRDQYVRPFEGQAGEILDLAASGDRQRLAVAGAAGDVRIYQMADRQRLALVAQIPAPAYAVALDAAGIRLAVGTKGGQVLFYEIPSGTLLKTLSPVPVEPGPPVAATP